MADETVGARIRAERRTAGLTQAELARRAGISPSYLNLIERNKRAVAGKLLARLAEGLGVARAALDGRAERALLDRLREIAADPRHAPRQGGLSPEEAAELIGRFPAWAEALADLARSERAFETRARTLSDRLTHDPFLGEAVHRMLTHTAALRAAAEILRDVPDLEPADRERFTGLVAAESAALSDVGTALAGYFDRASEPGGADADARGLSSTEAVEALFEARAGHFAEIEAGAAPEAVVEAAALPGEEARALARARLARYAEDARAAPLDAVLALARETGHDAAAMARRLGCGVDAVFRRLASLPPAPGRPRFGYLETNAAGVALEWRAIPGFAPPRPGTPCPLWVNHRACLRPGETVAQVATFPTGLRFLFVARTRRTGEAGHGRLALPVTDMLVLDAQAAGETVYAGAGEEAVGQSCRICPRADCAHRVADPVGAP